MSNAAYLPSREMRNQSSKQGKKWIYISCSAILAIVLVLMGYLYYQASRFNQNISINGVKVGGMTAEQAIKKLQALELKNEVYIGNEKIFDGEDTKAGYSNMDLPNVKELIKKQRTFFPSKKEINYTLATKTKNHELSQKIKQAITAKLEAKNKSIRDLQASKVRLENGKLISPSSVEKQYDIEKTIKVYEKQAFTSVIHLNPVFLQPTVADEQKVKNKEKMLRDLLGLTVNYQVQDKTYSLKGSDVIKNASVSDDMKYTIDPAEIKKRIAEINQTQSTLNKNFSFKTNSGQNISVKGESYGWALNVDKETKWVQEAFEKGETSLQAKNIYGTGWTTYGTGYQKTANNGIGDTYVEVSIKDQRIWVYKNGQLKLTTNVVTGWKGVNNQDTPTGVWYIEYKKSPSILRGSSFTHKNYAVHVDFWAPFTLSGCGLHDASWRTNWSSTAYLSDGSNGCVNISPSVMKDVFANIEVNEPVVIY
jgi:lipoprotein-anchoring transpeptidase ErfK/SrfK